MNKLLIFNNSVRAAFYDIPNDYLEHLLAEFHLEEEKERYESSIVFSFHDDLKVNLDAISRFKGPVAVDQKGLFFIDQADHIVRVEFRECENELVRMNFEVQYGFDPHFFYIIVLYAVSIAFVALGGAFVHAACLQRDEEVMLIPAWRHAGKTHLAFSLMKMGYKLVSDDGIWLSSKGEIYPVSKMIHILYHNVKLNHNLMAYLDEEDCKFFRLLESLDNQVDLLTNKQLRYMKSKFRVRKRINNYSNTQLRLSKTSRIILLNRNPTLHLDHQVKDVSIDIIHRNICASSKFELAHIFDLFNLWQCKFAQKCGLLENYQSYFDANLHGALNKAGKFQQYSFSNAPQKEKLFTCKLLPLF